jgi:hemerythrin-like domain-containing protein
MPERTGEVTMNVTGVMAALNTVEQDHRLVLERMQALKDSVDWLMSRTPEGARQALLQLREINKYFATEFTCHLEEEEQTLFPLLKQCNPEGREQVARLRTEHDTLRRGCQELEDCLQVAIELEDGLRKAVLRDIFIYGWRLWKLLDDHAHLETQMIHQCLEGALLNEPATS